MVTGSGTGGQWARDPGMIVEAGFGIWNREGYVDTVHDSVHDSSDPTAGLAWRFIVFSLILGAYIFIFRLTSRTWMAHTIYNFCKPVANLSGDGYFNFEGA